LSLNWQALSPQEASNLLFYRCVELMLQDKGYNITADNTVRVLTQRLYGDYRQVHNTAEFKRAEKHVFHFKNTGLGKQLF
jgi:hypothetical protein